MPWVLSREDLEEREAHAGMLVGQQVVEVRYFTIDYGRLEEDEAEGSRVVRAEEEWRDPPWRGSDFDAIDYGLEWETDQGETFAAIWEVAGDNEGLSLRRERLLEERLRADGTFAVWEVGRTRLWAPCVGRPVTGVELIWQRVEDLCCCAIVLQFGEQTRHLTLADADVQGRYVPSSDNVAVLDDEAARRYGDGGYGKPSETL